MKKYPVKYKDKDYGVIWYSSSFEDYMIIYKKLWIFPIKVYQIEEHNVNKYINISEEDPNYYIEQVKTLFYLWELEKKNKQNEKSIEDTKQEYLRRWNGNV